MIYFTFEILIGHKLELWDDDVEYWLVTIEVGGISVMNGVYFTSLDSLGFFWIHRSITGASLCLVWRCIIYLFILSRYFWCNDSSILIFETIGGILSFYFLHDEDHDILSSFRVLVIVTQTFQLEHGWLESFW